MPISFNFGRRAGGRDEPAAGSTTTPLATTLPLSLTPSEYIGFSRPAHGGKLIERTLAIVNHNALSMAFKVKTTAPKSYCVRPNAGRIKPGERVDLSILLKPMAEVPPSHVKCRDKFLVLSIPIIADKEHMSVAEIWSVVESDANAQVHQQKIRAVFLPAEDQTLEGGSAKTAAHAGHHHSPSESSHVAGGRLPIVNLRPPPISPPPPSPSSSRHYSLATRSPSDASNMTDTSQKDDLAAKLVEAQYEIERLRALQANLPTTDDLYNRRYQQLLRSQLYGEAAKVAATSPRGILRTDTTVEALKAAPTAPGELSPILQYFVVLLEHGELNKLESVEFARPALVEGRKELFKKWLKRDKLHCSEELGDMVRLHDTTLALSVYTRANAHDKVVECFAETGQTLRISLYAKRVGYRPDYAGLLRHIMRLHPKQAAEFTRQLVDDESVPLADVERVMDTFLGQNIPPATHVMLDALNHNQTEQGHLAELTDRIVLEIRSELPLLYL